MYRDDIMNALREIREMSTRLDNLEGTINNIDTMMKHLLGCIKSSYDSFCCERHLYQCGILSEDELTPYTGTTLEFEDIEDISEIDIFTIKNTDPFDLGI